MPDLNKIIEDLSSLTVAEAAELSKQLEEKWGVTPMAAAAPAAAPVAELEDVNSAFADLVMESQEEQKRKDALAQAQQIAMGRSPAANPCMKLDK